MPELPEVEITKKTLQKHVVDQTIQDLQIKNRNLRYKIDVEFKNKIVKKKIVNISRRSKYLIFLLYRHQRADAGQQKCEVPLLRSGRTRLRRARARSLGARCRRGHEFHGEPDARTYARGCAHALHHHPWWRCAERRTRVRGSVLLRSASQSASDG